MVHRGFSGWGVVSIGRVVGIAALIGLPVVAETLYVSKIGSNGDGRSWDTAFHTVQQALAAVPDAAGGHRIVVRPDVYMEANLFPAQRGAAGAYNEIIGDVDGSLGSGARGWVVIDSGDPAKGLKAYDWWGPIRAYAKGWSKEHTEETFSAIVWDRWRMQHLYFTGAEAGPFFDCTDHVEPFTVVVEDCVGIGRAFGGGVAACLPRAGEPIVFRRCNLWSLDFWGDTAGAYARLHNESMPATPDIYFDDCTLVSPQCAVKTGNYGFKTYTYVSVKDSRLIALNFSQPAGTPTDGILQSVEHGKYMRVDLEDCTLMGYKPFGVKVSKGTEGEIVCTTRGAVQAYVQFQQEVPSGMHALGGWPSEIFGALAPPAATQIPTLTPSAVVPVRKDRCEVTPIMWKGALHLLEAERPASGGTAADYHLSVSGPDGVEVARFAEGYSLASAIVHEDTLYAFASRFEDNNWNDVTVFWSKDLKHWESKRAIAQEANEHLFNSSVCAAPDGFVMAYETNDPAWPAFTIKFARSTDLVHWEKVEGAVLGHDRYAACPTIRYVNDKFYVFYLEHRVPRWQFEAYVARSADLRAWEVGRKNPVIAPHGLKEGINASDPDLIEIDGKTRLYYAVGDQKTWMNIQAADYTLPLGEFCAAFF